MVYTFEQSLQVGDYRVVIPAGDLGRGSEPMREDFSVTFRVREPGFAMIVTTDDGQELVEVREGEQRLLAQAPRIIDYAISPDGTQVAVVVAAESSGDGTARGGLVMVPTDGGVPQSLVQSPEINIGGVTWAPDGTSLLVVRRDTLPGGGEGVPRAWLLRITGEFIAPVDPNGNPSLNPSWSPDGQHLAYVSPSDGRLVAYNLSTQVFTNMGQPRGGRAEWSPNSQLVAWESVPRNEGSNPIQPIRVKSLDGAYDRTFGVEGETRLAPKLLDNDTLVSLRRQVGSGARGTELVFEALEDGRQLRAIFLAGGTDLVLEWDLDPAKRRVVYTVQTGQVRTTLVLDLESGDREPIDISGDRPRWLP
jgi:dipeptidyl aminopeptidase/acylaminoacyl peptidase